MSAIGVSQGLLALAGLAASTAYVDARLNVSKDLNAILRVRRATKNFTEAVKNRKASGFFLFQETVRRHPDASCIWSRQGEYTWAQAYARSCQYGHYFQSLGIKSPEYVGLYLYNSPEFIFAWMGLLSIGAAPALINYNLASDALVHCVRLSTTRVLLYDSAADCVSRIEGSTHQLNELGLKTVCLSDKFVQELGQFSSEAPQTDAFEKAQKILPFGLFYTSGTTGLPKAFPVNADRNYGPASVSPRGFGQVSGAGGDRVYYCIPLYHGTGGINVMHDLMSGLSVAVAPKFSTSKFWTDCIDSQATVFLYVGELIRYLLAAPSSPNDQKHQIRLAWGNGLSPELWNKFRDRFNVAEIGEFFGSTEGFLTLVNLYRGGATPKSVGHHGWVLRQMHHSAYVPVYIDPDTGDIWRSPETGFAKRMPYEEGGEIIIKLPSKEAWTGYFRSKEASEKKLFENAFEKGDVYVRTGDALRRDSDGHWFFMDRLGDTYRWKGENVSTTEVTQALGGRSDVAEANVYGVQIPSHDGRAGCAAIVLKDVTLEKFDWTGLTSYLRSELPSYAVPIFMRVLDGGVGRMGTGNHKHNKVPLRLEGVDPRKLGEKVDGGDKDTLFWLPAGSPKYVPFTLKEWDALTQARARI